MNSGGKIMIRNVRLVSVVVLVMSCCFVSSGQAEPRKAAIVRKPKYSWQHTDSSQALLNHGRIVWQLNFDKKEGKPYFHPVSLIDGTELTWLRPADHRWHRALWFSWKFINGVNYWEEDPKTGLSPGRTELVEVKFWWHNDWLADIEVMRRSADIEMMLSYHRPGGPAVLTEKRLIAVSAPDKNGRYHIDWHSTFTAGEKDVLLSRTPIPGEQGGMGWGGYAGLSIRMAEAARGFQFVDSRGRKDKQIHGKKARWVDFSGELPNGKEAGITILDHPENLWHPSPWYVEKGMPYFSPAVLFNKSYKIEAKKSLTLWYRILIHPGRMDKEALEREFKTLLNTTDLDIRFESAKKLMALGRAMVTYSGDYGFKYPDLHTLHKYGNLKKKELVWLLENVVYLGKGKTDGTIRPDTVLGYDKTLLEKEGCTNVLFADLRVKFLKSKQLEKYGIRRLGEGKTAIKVDLLVCEVIEDAEIDSETAVEIKNLLGEEVGFSPVMILKKAVRAKQVAKDKLERLVDLLSSSGYLKILMNPTLEVLTGKTAKVRSSQTEPTGKQIIDSFEVTPRILDDGSISMATEVVFTDKNCDVTGGDKQAQPPAELRMRNDEIRIRSGESVIIGYIGKTQKLPEGVQLPKDAPLIDALFRTGDLEEGAKETLFIVTAAVCKGD
jgi:hypothetical protein